MTIQINGKPYPKYWKYRLSFMTYNVWMTIGIEKNGDVIIKRMGKSKLLYSNLLYGWPHNSIPNPKIHGYTPLNFNEDEIFNT